MCEIHSSEQKSLCLVGDTSLLFDGDECCRSLHVAYKAEDILIDLSSTERKQRWTRLDER